MMKGLNDDEILDFIELTRNKPIDVRSFKKNFKSRSQSYP